MAARRTEREAARSKAICWQSVGNLLSGGKTEGLLVGANGLAAEGRVESDQKSMHGDATRGWRTS